MKLFGSLVTVAFFGASVVGCFVFALGVMAGRRLEGGQEGGAHPQSEVSSLQALDAEPTHEAFVFEKGLAESELDAVPPTRDPSVPPRSKEEIAAAMAEEADGEFADATPVSPKSAPLPDKPAPKSAGPAKVIADADQASKPAAAPAAANKAAEKPSSKPADKAAEPVLANATPPSQQAPEPAKGTRTFTLQMKAFADAADADKLAETLRGNGHDVRVDVQEVRGRVWHRVRLGKYSSWDDAVAAKMEFEKQEKMIAYVMTN